MGGLGRGGDGRRRPVGVEQSATAGELSTGDAPVREEGSGLAGEYQWKVGKLARGLVRAVDDRRGGFHGEVRPSAAMACSGELWAREQG